MAPADEAKIGRIFLPLAAIIAAGVLPLAKLQRDRSDVVGRGRTRAETVIASPEDCPKYAITRDFLVLAHDADPQTLTRETGCLG